MSSRFVPYHKESVEFAKGLTFNCPTLLGRYRKIINYINKTFIYNYICAIQPPKKNDLPSVKQCWEKKTGACVDISAMATGMMRAVGIDARLCRGKADGQPHAWVEAWIDGKHYRYDHWIGKVRKYSVEKMYI